MIAIIGAGVSGLSCSYFIGHKKCLIFEKSFVVGGLAASNFIDGVRWENGPHVSFTKNSYIADFLEKNIQGAFTSIPVSISNYYYGSWVPHPAQLNLYAIPEPMRTKSLNSFLESQSNIFGESQGGLANYKEWLNKSFGKVFADNFPAVYTRKYWTVEPEVMALDWIGDRVSPPSRDEVIAGYKKLPTVLKHYVTHVRYPNTGGFFKYFEPMLHGAKVLRGAKIQSIDLNRKLILLADGNTYTYNKLINTIPLPEFLKLCSAPEEILKASESLRCTSALLVNVTSLKKTEASNTPHWFYVYDNKMLSCRVSRSDLLSKDNAPNNVAAFQVEVYFSKDRPLPGSYDEVVKLVVLELIKMGVIDKAETTNYKVLNWANVIFDMNRRGFQNKVLHWLEGYGLVRESDDLSPMTNWSDEKKFNSTIFGDLIMAGRFAQWKYFWTDDCMLRGRQIAGCLRD